MLDSNSKSAAYERQVDLAPDAASLVNQLTAQLALAQRTLAAAQQKTLTATRTLEARTHELTDAKAALSLLLATLDSTSDGLLAVGYFGRATHFNTRFTEMWRIGADKVESLNDSAVLAVQLAQVRDPVQFLAEAEARKVDPDSAHFSRIELMDGRVFECHAMPQRVRGKRVGTVTRYRDITDSERLARILALVETTMPEEVAQARASVY